MLLAFNSFHPQLERPWAATLGVTILVSIESSFSQGFVFNNTGGNGAAVAPIYGPDPANPYRQLWGNTPIGRPPGTQAYAGAPLAGTNYSVQAWYSVTPVSDVFQLVGDARPVPGALGSFVISPGYFNGGERTIPDAVISTTNTGPIFYAFLQVRTWDNAGGQLASWDDAWNAALAGSGRVVGWSKQFFQPLAVGLVPYPGMENFESFNAFIVPEPSTIALVVLGGAALLCGLSRRQWVKEKRPPKSA